MLLRAGRYDPPRIVEAGAVGPERYAVVEAPGQPVGEVAPGIHFPDADLDFVLARLPHGIRGELAVARNAEELRVHRPIGRERRGVEQDFLGTVK